MALWVVWCGVANVRKVDIENSFVKLHRIRLLGLSPGVRFCVDRKEIGKEMENTLLCCHCD